MADPVSYSSQERLSYFKEKHDAYKSLISRLAEQLRAEDMECLFWYIDAPPDLRGCSALQVLEYLQRLGKFSEKASVQYLSKLMKEIKRIDLMEEVDSYSQNYVRHCSLPAVAVNPPPQTPRSFSTGNHFTHSTPLPCEETGSFLGHSHLSDPKDTSGDQADLGTHLVSVASGISDSMHTTQKPATAQSCSMEGLSRPRWCPGPPLSYNMNSPGLGPSERQRGRSSLTDCRSLSTSGSIHFHYSSHPSSGNASQEAFHPEHTSVYIPSGDVHLSHTPGVQVHAEYFNNFSRPHSNSFPHSNWYQHSSLGSIPQEPENSSCVANQMIPCDARKPPLQQYMVPHSVTGEGPHSQDSLHGPIYRHTPQVQPMLYFHTPPYNRRTPAMVGYNRGPRLRHQSVGEYPVRSHSAYHSEPSPPSQSEHRGPSQPEHRGEERSEHSTQMRNEQHDEFPQPSIHHPTKEAASNFPQSAYRGEANKNICDSNPLTSKEYVTQSQCDQNKAVAHVKENLLANNMEHVVRRRRANSLHQDSEYKAKKLNNRLSVMSVDERQSRHLDPDQKTLRTNNRHSFMSVDERRLNNHISPTSSTIGSTRQISGSKGSAVNSSTPDSEEAHLSPTASSTKISSHTHQNHAHKQKATLLSRLTQQFSRIVKPHKEIEWPIKRSKLNKIIYEQKDKYLTCPFRLELDGGLKGSNPRLTLHVHPYGKEEDSNCNITLEVGLEVPTHPNAQRLDSHAKVEVNVKAEDAERKVVFGRRVVRECLRLNYFYLKGFVCHQALKQSQSNQVLFTISANLITAV